MEYYHTVSVAVAKDCFCCWALLEIKCKCSMGRHYIGVALDRSSCTIDAAAPKFCFSPCNTGLGNLTPCHLLLEHDSTLLILIMIRAPARQHTEGKSTHVRSGFYYALLRITGPASRFTPYKAQHVLDRDFKKLLASRSRGARQGGDACVRYY